MSKFYLFIGIFLICSGLGAAIGIAFLLAYFWSDIKDELKKQQTPTSEQEDFSINSMSDNLREKLI